MTIVEVESKISVLESTRDAIAKEANLQMAPLNAQLQSVILAATEKLAKIDGQLSILAELKAELLPKPAVESTPDPVSDSDAAEAVAV